MRALGSRAGLIVRPRRFSWPFAFVFGWLYVLPWLILNVFRVTIAMLVWVDDDGSTVYRRRVPVPRGGIRHLDPSIVDRP